MKARVAALLALAAALAACTSHYQAPVIERATATPPAAARAREARPDAYTVRRGDTLYNIALDHGLEYREIADWNGIANPDSIQVGQVLRLKAPESNVQVRPLGAPGQVEARPLGAPGQAQPRPQAAEAPRAQSGSLKTEPRAVKLPYTDENLALLTRRQARAEPRPEPQPAAPADSAAGDDDEKLDWGWPLSGKVIAGFSESSNKGVDIGAKLGDPVHASASGRVVYSGTGLRGYGKLVIIKHNATYLSAYAHNQNLLVKEGQNVVKGQKIAEAGDSDADRAKLHFEIRRMGKPVDPLKFLPDHPS